MKTYAGRGTPGPCTYQTPGGLGKQPDSKYSSEPAWRQGTSERFRWGFVVRGVRQRQRHAVLLVGRPTKGGSALATCVCRQHEDKDKPGVGAYTVKNDAIGKQALSSKKTLPSAKIGTSNRDAAKKVRNGRLHRHTLAAASNHQGCHHSMGMCLHPLPFAAPQIFISKEHEKAAFGLWSPGPVTSKAVNSFGSQTLSVKKTNPSWGFGTGKVRWHIRLITVLTGQGKGGARRRQRGDQATRRFARDVVRVPAEGPGLQQRHARPGNVLGVSLRACCTMTSVRCTLRWSRESLNVQQAFWSLTTTLTSTSARAPLPALSAIRSMACGSTHRAERRGERALARARAGSAH